MSLDLKKISKKEPKYPILSPFSGVVPTRVPTKSVPTKRIHLPSIALNFSQVRRFYSVFSWEPLFTGLHSFRFEALEPNSEKEIVTLAGSLCTGTDVIAEDIEMPRLEIGDLVIITNAGAYAASFSPMQFSSQEAPGQVLMRTDGSFAE